jgi:type VI secretion system secreted protein Hcp
MEHRTMRGYAKIGDFAGESSDSGHEGWSIIKGLSSGLSHSMGAYSHAEGTKGSVQVGSIVLEKETDAATVKLQRALLAREKIPKVEIHICGVISNKREPFLIYELEDVFATSFQFSNSITEAGTVPTESVTFDFKKIKWTYVQYGADGKKEGKVTHEYKVGEKN